MQEDPKLVNNLEYNTIAVDWSINNLLVKHLLTYLHIWLGVCDIISTAPSVRGC